MGYNSFLSEKILTYSLFCILQKLNQSMDCDKFGCGGYTTVYYYLSFKRFLKACSFDFNFLIVASKICINV